MLVQLRMLFTAAVAAGLCAGPVIAQEPAAAPAGEATPAAPPPAAAPSPQAGDSGSKPPALEPVTELEPAPAPAAEPPVQENPWSRGVPHSERRAAEALFLDGNKLLRESITLLAVSRYREALTHWDHPNIHFNLAIALVAVDQPVEAHDHLQRAIEYGAKPLEEERFRHARNYLLLLEKQLVQLRVRCEVPEGVVEMDGRQLFATPGEWSGLVRAGRHTLVARREGYVTNQSVRIFEGGQAARIDLELKTLGELTQHSRRWSAWKPWTVLGAGAALAVGGGLMQYQGRQDVAAVDRKSRELCPDGCDREPGDVNRLRRRGDLLQKAAVGAYAVGGAAVVVGGVLTFLNRDHVTVRPYDTTTVAEEPAQARLEVSPLVTPDAPGLSVLIRF